VIERTAVVKEFLDQWRRVRQMRLPVLEKKRAKTGPASQRFHGRGSMRASYRPTIVQSRFNGAHPPSTKNSAAPTDKERQNALPGRFQKVAKREGAVPRRRGLNICEIHWLLSKRIPGG
jgi:hypothetical protein